MERSIRPDCHMTSHHSLETSTQEKYDINILSHCKTGIIPKLPWVPSPNKILAMWPLLNYICTKSNRPNVFCCHTCNNIRGFPLLKTGNKAMHSYTCM